MGGLGFGVRFGGRGAHQVGVDALQPGGQLVDRPLVRGVDGGAALLRIFGVEEGGSVAQPQLRDLPVRRPPDAGPASGATPPIPVRCLPSECGDAAAVAGGCGRASRGSSGEAALAEEGLDRPREDNSGTRDDTTETTTP